MDKEDIRKLVEAIIADGEATIKVIEIPMPQPDCFVVDEADMREFLKLKHHIEKHETIDLRLKERIVTTMTKVFDNSKMLMHDDTKLIIEAMDLLAADTKDKEASATDEWINCY